MFSDLVWIPFSDFFLSDLEQENILKSSGLEVGMSCG